MKKILTLGLITLTTIGLSGCSFVSSVGQLYKDIIIGHELNPEQIQSPVVDDIQKDTVQTKDQQSGFLNVTVAHYQMSYAIYNDPSGHRIVGFINMETNEQVEFDLDNIENEEDAEFPQQYLDYSSYLDFTICHQGNKILKWDAYIRETQEMVNNKTKAELAEILHLNVEFDDYAYLVPMQAPEVIHLSNWEKDKYVCIRLNKNDNGKYYIPPVINDTHNHVAKVHFAYFTPEYNPPIEDEYFINIHMWEPTYREIDKEIIVFKWTSVPNANVLNSCNVVQLSNYSLNDIVSVHFNRYFYNDTKSTITLTSESGDQEISILPSHLGEVTWSVNNVIITNIS